MYLAVSVTLRPELMHAHDHVEAKQHAQIYMDKYPYTHAQIHMMAYKHHILSNWKATCSGQSPLPLYRHVLPHHWVPFLQSNYTSMLVVY